MASSDASKSKNLFPGFYQPGVGLVVQFYPAHVSVKYLLTVGWLWYHHNIPSSQLHINVLDKSNFNVLNDILPCCSHFAIGFILPVCKHRVA